MIGVAREQADKLRLKKLSDEINHLKTLDNFLGLGRWLAVHEDGPLWFRGFSQWTDEEEQT
jgi:hypothetical protein